MEDQHPTLFHSRRIQNRPPLLPEATPRHFQKHKKMWSTECSTSGATNSCPPPEIDELESSFPVSIEPEITSPLAGEFNIVQIEELEISLPEVIEPDYTK